MHFFTCTSLIVLSFGIAKADDDSYSTEGKTGQYPFMVFLYYTDDTINDSSGNRFMKTGFLIKLDWIVSASLDPGADGLGFPRKTLLARAGAAVVDSKFTLNEDENEQEKEVILLIRPVNHEPGESWKTDISLMKTLLPFNASLTVSVLAPHFDHVFKEKTCMALVYAKNATAEGDEKALISLSVDRVDGTQCEPNFINSTMICTNDNEDTKKKLQNPQFCQGNTGGPLLCEGEIMGIQNYISDHCEAPRRYQSIPAWKELIICAIENKYSTMECSTVCAVVSKDTPVVQMSDLLSSETTTETLPPNVTITEIVLERTGQTTQTLTPSSKSWLFSEYDEKSSEESAPNTTIAPVVPERRADVDNVSLSSSTTSGISSTVETTTVATTIKESNIHAVSPSSKKVSTQIEARVQSSTDSSQKALRILIDERSKGDMNKVHLAIQFLAMLLFTLL